MHINDLVKMTPAQRINEYISDKRHLLYRLKGVGNYENPLEPHYPKPGAGWEAVIQKCPNCDNPWLWRLPEYLTNEELQCHTCKAYKGDNGEWTFKIPINGS